MEVRGPQYFEKQYTMQKKSPTLPFLPVLTLLIMFLPGRVSLSETECHADEVFHVVLFDRKQIYQPKQCVHINLSLICTLFLTYLLLSTAGKSLRRGTSAVSHGSLSSWAREYVGNSEFFIQPSTNMRVFNS